MGWYSNLKISTKLVSGFVLVALIAGIIGFVGVSSIAKVVWQQQDAYQYNLLPINYLGKAAPDFQKIRIALRDTLLSETPEKSRRFREEVVKANQQLEDDFSYLDKLIRLPNQRPIYDQLVKDVHAYVAWEEKVLSMAEQKKPQAGFEILRSDEYQNITNSIGGAIQKLQEMKEANAKIKAGKSAKEGRRAIVTSIALTVLGMILALGLGIFLARSICRPIVDLTGKAKRITEGDLEVEVVAATRDEVGMLSSSFGTMVESLRGIIGEVGAISGQLAAAAQQLTVDSLQIAAGTEEVASQAGTVSVAGDEIASTSGEIALSCQKAAEESRQACDAATAGAEVVNKTVQVMSRIAERVGASARTVESLGARSDQIGEIIGTIEDIADQTNLLALNAAIEAARAGEQGRGFAVVADEVRALADRTTKATREIGEMIKAIQMETRGAVSAMEEGVSEVQSGTAEAAKSGEALQTILAQINTVTRQINQVAIAAEGQTATTMQINDNIQQITNVVHETATGAHRSAAAATDLTTMAEQQRKIVSRFRV